MANTASKGFPSRSALGVTAGSSTGTTSGSSSNVSITSVGGAQTQLAVTANAPFELNDLVFVDWKTGAIVNQSNMPPKAALATGPTLQAFFYDDFPGATANSVGSLTQIGPDGSMYLLASGYSGSGPYRRSITLYKYNSRGVVQAKGQVFNVSNDNSVAILVNSCSFSLLSNGNILVTWLTGQNVSTISFSILNPSLRAIYSGTIAGASGVGVGIGVFHIQPTSNGGAILFTGNGIDYVSATGVTSRPVTSLLSALAWHNHLKDANAPYDTYAKPVPVKSGTAGAFGYVFTSSSGSGGCYYAVIEADGSLRGAVVTLIAAVYQQLCIAVSPTTNNIMWSNYISGYYGVVSDAGVVVKASSALTNANTTIGIRLSSDAGGNFLIVSCNLSDYKWYLRYMTPAGVDVSAASPLVSLGSNVGPYNAPVVAKLTTGTVYLLPCSTNTSWAYYAFVNNAGVVVKLELLLNFGYSGGGTGLGFSVTVFNDMVYGAASVGLTSSPVDLLTFTISNTGVTVLSGDAMNAITGRGTIDVSYPIRSFVDETGKYLYFVCTTVSSSYLVVITYDLNLNFLSYTNFNTVTQAFYNSSNIRVFAQGLLLSGASGYNDASSLGTLAVYLKPKTTILLGVAANAAAEGGALVVNTKGVFPVSSPWKAVFQTFDASANVPAGNSGFMSSGFINLKGFS
jgi:hypothetical protein